MIRSKPLWQEHYSTSQGFYFGGLCIINTLVHRAGAGKEVYCRLGQRGRTAPGTAVSRLKPKEDSFRVTNLDHRGVIFMSHK